MAVSLHAPPYINDAPFAGGAGFSSYRNGTTLIFVRAENWRSSQPATDAQFHDSIEVAVEPDCPFKTLRPKRLNEFGIPEKKHYRSEDVATALGISTDLLRWRLRNGKYPEVGKDSAGMRMFSLNDIKRLANSRLRLAHHVKIGKTQKMPTK